MNLEELSLLNAIITVLWIMGPAYIANSVAVLTGGKYPIDQGRTLSDGNRILGDGKTWSGLLGGTLGGIMFGIILDSGDGRMALERLTGEEHVQSLWSENPVMVFFLLSFGALFGDMAASFYKRRQNLLRGDKFAILDMYDFIFMSLLLCIIFQRDWLLSWILDGWAPLFTVLILTPFLHRGVNIIGYNIGVKNEPW
ncbi:MAG: CDP-2,3-bis-(O-geranylgeranyl)-sn-glycerol synthase [Candidatus Thermoplasmatota archaeon]|nr:CDP-2,3-bis-(O-geranylgeranyl)-sn-glycerol synthase [bacterium]MEC7135976.1 CDP-2,3-bis-(O-geranylgeranyl)-sn-glycerol synthase [Candidatus Thermoplasmatota archaeon]MEC7416105.1 CDP-2,3-bis-(O-geranylgeranyl)-sn-glycerol synthase [Candidatus Thermoplasmatota archaeon]MEC8671305.1 CDP-2,3-bis-(O-geranylgeranyl)-sn-glycerol synthase [Candidatus Thermoplasmatota archaeon]MEE3081658.1 CDP-2,3-bis-(O-geranylgeranyl)-sn-glycerol synthase [Candidatus Thermoplasmatota archaeon]